ncbi:hypothetical protein ACWC09_52330, partial [Streptomyces sp. NPDC001617]
LPPATGEVWRGKRSAEELFAGTGHGDPAASGRSEFTFPAFASFSRDEFKASVFMWATPLPGTLPVLVRVELTGNWGRDITPFSNNPHEEEVLLLPGARLGIEARTVDSDGRGDFEHIRAREVPPPSAGLLGGSPDAVAGSSGSRAVEPDSSQVGAVSVLGDSVVSDSTSAPGSGPDLGVLYTDPEYLPRAREFEQRLGEFASGHPAALRAARRSVERLFKVLTDAHPAERREDIAKVLLDGLEPVGRVRGTTARSRLQGLLESGGSRELMTAFTNGVLFHDSPLTLKALLRDIAESGDWARAASLGLDAEALREGLAVLEGAELPSGVFAGTAARLGNAFGLLNVPETDGEAFALAVIGRMLPLGDRSLYEVLAGLQATDVVPSLAGNPLDDAALVYRSIPGVSLAEVRRNVGDKGMLPHEALYWHKITTHVQRGGFAEPGAESLAIAQLLRKQFESLVGTRILRLNVDASTRRWLRENHMTASQVLEKLSPAHFAVLAAYTTTASPLINTVLKFGSAEVRPELRRRVRRLINEHLHLGKDLSPVLGDDPAAARLLDSYRRNPYQLQERERLAEAIYAAAERLLPAIEREMTAHAAMLLDALEQLPPATGEVWRGKRSLADLHAGIGPIDSADPGVTELSFPAFASFSRNEALAMQYLDRNWVPGLRRVLVRAQLAGNMGRDITPFSANPLEEEVLLLPGARLKIESRELVPNHGHRYERIVAREVLPLSAELRRFAVTFGKLEERAAEGLWVEAARVTAQHNPFRLRVAEGPGSLLERDSEQYWATMRVAQELHENEGAPDRLERAVEVAKTLAAERGVDASRRPGLRGGSPDVTVAESSRAGASAFGVAMGEAAAVADGSEATDEVPGPLRVLYTDRAYVPLAQGFEESLATYAATHPRALEMARSAVNVLFGVLSGARPGLRGEEILQVFRPDGPMPDPAEEEAWATGIDDLTERDLPGLMAAFHQGALSGDSPLGLQALLREIAGSGDWARAQELGLDVEAVREGVTPALLPERASRTAAELGNVLRVLNLADQDGDGFALALIAWLLPQREESLYEVLAGLRTTGVVPSLAGDALQDPARMYRSVPGLELGEIRREVADDGLLPHEAVYWSKIQDGVFSEPAEELQDNARQQREWFSDLADRARQRREGSSDLDHTLPAERWLLRHDMAAQEVLDRLSLPHFVALMAY